MISSKLKEVGGVVYLEESSPLEELFPVCSHQIFHNIKGEECILEFKGMPPRELVMSRDELSMRKNWYLVEPGDGDRLFLNSQEGMSVVSTVQEFLINEGVERVTHERGRFPNPVVELNREGVNYVSENQGRVSDLYEYFRKSFYEPALPDSRLEMVSDNHSLSMSVKQGILCMTAMDETECYSALTPVIHTVYAGRVDDNALSFAQQMVGEWRDASLKVYHANARAKS